MLKRERENKNRLLIKYTVIFGILSESDIYYALQKKTIEYSLLQSLYALNAIEWIEKGLRWHTNQSFCLIDIVALIFLFSALSNSGEQEVNMLFNSVKNGAKYYIIGWGEGVRGGLLGFFLLLVRFF